MTSTRIPRADVRTPFARLVRGVSRRALGQVPDNAHVLLHNPRVLRAVVSFEAKVARFDRLDPHLRAYAELAAAGVVGCSWCLDFGRYVARTRGLDQAKVAQVPQWRTATVFDDTERGVMAYAEAMTATPPTVTDDMVEALLAALGAPAVVELTQVVALENMRSRFNAAAGLQSQGFSDRCDLAPAPSDASTYVDPDAVRSGA